MSYRQFFSKSAISYHRAEVQGLRCVCVTHENMRLLVQKLAIKGLLETTSISELLSMIVCDLKKKVCMERVSTMLVELPEIERAAVSWEQWERVTSSNVRRPLSCCIVPVCVHFTTLAKSSSKES